MLRFLITGDVAAHAFACRVQSGAQWLKHSLPGHKALEANAGALAETGRIGGHRQPPGGEKGEDSW
jgi:ubiquinone biosynthesis protein UbiJ